MDSAEVWEPLRWRTLEVAQYGGVVVELLGLRVVASSVAGGSLAGGLDGGWLGWLVASEDIRPSEIQISSSFSVWSLDIPGMPDPGAV